MTHTPSRFDLMTAYELAEAARPALQALRVSAPPLAETQTGTALPSTRQLASQLEALIRHAAGLYGIRPADFFDTSTDRSQAQVALVSRFRGLVAAVAIHRLGLTRQFLSRSLGISRHSIDIALRDIEADPGTRYKYQTLTATLP